MFHALIRFECFKMRVTSVTIVNKQQDNLLSNKLTK